MMQLQRQHATSCRAAVITAVVGVLAAASLLLLPVLPVVHQITGHSDHSGPSGRSDQPGDCAPTTDCFLCLHFDQDGSGEASIVPTLYSHQVVASIALPVLPATATGTVRLATARSPPAFC
jgi:hypothetical protein